MKKKAVLRFLAIFTLLYPALMLFKAEEILRVSPMLETKNEILNYQISIWISWLVFASLAVYHKWTEKSNFFFYFTYGFIIIGFTVYGFLYQRFIVGYELPSPFGDKYTLGVFVAIQNIMVSGILTGFLQAAVWWFTRRWHRR